MRPKRPVEWLKTSALRHRTLTCRPLWTAVARHANLIAFVYLLTQRSDAEWSYRRPDRRHYSAFMCRVSESSPFKIGLSKLRKIQLHDGEVETRETFSPLVLCVSVRRVWLWRRDWEGGGAGLCVCVCVCARVQGCFGRCTWQHGVPPNIKFICWHADCFA